MEQVDNLMGEVQLVTIKREDSKDFHCSKNFPSFLPHLKSSHKVESLRKGTLLFKGKKIGDRNFLPTIILSSYEGSTESRLSSDGIHAYYIKQKLEC
jgi:hypothetical protein